MTSRDVLTLLADLLLGIVLAWAYARFVMQGAA
jgi:hypothetical protein